MDLVSGTRTYILLQLLSCGHTSAKVDILSRYVKFFHSLRKSASHEVQVLSRYLARDVQSVTGRNLRLVQETANLDPWTTVHQYQQPQEGPDQFRDG